jgi:SAM-dependent methyltransferase
MVARLKARCEGVRRVLDAPCGTGRMTPLTEGAALRVSMDISMDMLRKVDAGSTRRALADIERLPVRDGAFDLVLSVRFLHHLPSDDLVGRCLAELARASSRYVLVSYYRSTTFQYARRVLKRILKGRQSHRIGRVFRALAARAGLRPVAIETSAPWVSEQYFVLFEKAGAAG